MGKNLKPAYHLSFLETLPQSRETLNATMSTGPTGKEKKYIQGEDRKKWPPMKIGFLDYNCVKRAENVEKFINRTVQLPNMTEGLTLLNLKCNFHHTNR